jgi:hypothetical protein
VKNETKIQKFLCLMGGLMIATGLSVFAARAEEPKPVLKEKKLSAKQAAAVLLAYAAMKDAQEAAAAPKAAEASAVKQLQEESAKTVAKECPGMQLIWVTGPAGTRTGLKCVAPPPAPEKKP